MKYFHNITKMSDLNNVEVINLGDVTKICRLCLEKNITLQPLQESPLLEHFRLISKLPLKLDTELPKTVCDQCWDRLSQLKQLTRFLLHCKRSQGILKDFYKNAVLGQCIVKRQVMVKGQLLLEIIQGVIPEKKQNFEQVNNDSVDVKENINSLIHNHQADPPEIPTMEIATESNVVPIEDIPNSSEENNSDAITAKRSQQTADEEMKSETESESEYDEPPQLFCFPCEQCSFKADSTISLTNHCINIHGTRKTCCPDCKQVVVDLQKHKMPFGLCNPSECKAKEVGRVSRFCICDRCGKGVYNVRNHQQTSCNNARCKHCGFSATTTFEMRKHIAAKHATQRTSCPICKRDDIADLYVHRKENKECQPKCTKCDYRTLKQSRMVKHMRVHSDVRMFTCDKCGVSFKYSANLKRHKRLHDFGAEFTCAICPRKFSTKPHMQGHMNLAHYGIKPYKCNFCEESFAYIMTRSWHSKREHPDQYVPQVRNKRVLNYKTKDLTALATEKRFQCEQCNKTYKTEIGFNAHKLKHDEKKDASSCSDCDYKTTNRNDMRAHMREHIMTNKRKRCAQNKSISMAYKTSEDEETFTNGNE